MGRFGLPQLIALASLLGACSGRDDTPPTPEPDIIPLPTADTGNPVVEMPGPPWGVTLEGFGFFNALGAPARAVLANNENIEIARAEVEIVNGSWRVHWPDVLENGEAGYWLAIWVDNSANEICGPNDVAYVFPVSAFEDRLILVPFVQEIDFDACIGWL